MARKPAISNENKRKPWEEYLNGKASVGEIEQRMFDSKYE